MMDDMEAGKVNCIVTKDLSRFGREHVMMDYYLEFLFPEKRVRYIAVAENEDTEKGLSDFVPFKNLFNEWFAKDTSRKVKAAFKAKFATGQRIGAYAPIGYRKHPEIKNKLIIDEETRWIVEKIFDLAIHGRGAASITRILIMEKVPTPGFINFQRDGTFANIYAGAPEEKSYAWTIAQVKSIMKDETYIGHTIHYRETNISFKNKRRIRKPQSEWVRVENTQEPIISEQVFRQVQEQIANRRRKCKDGTTQIFSGLVKCADCGWSLSYGENRQNSKPYGHYHCSKYGQGTRQCSMHYIRYDVLYAYVLSRLQYWSGLVQHDEERLLKQLLNATDKGQAAARKKQAAELKKAEKRKAEVDTLFARMYEDWAAGRITEYNFSMLSGKYQSEQAELDEKIERLQSAIATESQNAADAEKWIALMKECVNPTELTAELLNTLIEKILVHVRGDVGRGAPAGAAVLHALAVFFRVSALGVDRQPDQHCAGGAHAQVHQMEAGRQAGKGRRKALPDVKQFLRGVRPRRQPYPLAELVKEIHEDEIREVEDELFFQLVGHRATSRSLVLTFSRWRCWVLACSWA